MQGDRSGGTFDRVFRTCTTTKASMDLNMSSLAHAYPRCGTLCDMIILCTADFNLCVPQSVHEGDIKRAVDEKNMRR